MSLFFTGSGRDGYTFSAVRAESRKACFIDVYTQFFAAFRAVEDYFIVLFTHTSIILQYKINYNRYTTDENIKNMKKIINNYNIKKYSISII